MLTLTLLLAANIGFEYLTVDPIAHRVGMGYAQFADGYSVSYNPAGLSYNFDSYYSVSYLSYIGDTHFGYLGYEKNQLGLGIRYFHTSNCDCPIFRCPRWNISRHPSHSVATRRGTKV